MYVLSQSDNPFVYCEIQFGCLIDVLSQLILNYCRLIDPPPRQQINDFSERSASADLIA